MVAHNRFYLRNAIGRGYLNPLVLGSKTALVLENNEDPNYSELNIPCTWLNVGRGPQHSVNKPEADTCVRLGKAVILYHYDMKVEIK